MEAPLTNSGPSLDALVEVNGKQVGIEVDGPIHFIGRQPTGSIMLKRRQIANMEGISFVSIPYWESRPLQEAELSTFSTRIHLNDGVINFDSRDSMLVPSCYVGIKGRLYGKSIHACRFFRLRWSL